MVGVVDVVGGSGSDAGSGSGSTVTCGIRSDVSRAGISGTWGSTISSSGLSFGRLAISAAWSPVGSPTTSVR